MMQRIPALLAKVDKLVVTVLLKGLTALALFMGTRCLVHGDDVAGFGWFLVAANVIGFLVRAYAVLYAPSATDVASSATPADRRPSTCP